MKYQQGDVLFNEVSDNYEIIKDKERTYKYSNGTGSHITVALGEATGHSHTFYATDNRQGLVTSFGANNMGAVGSDVPSYINIANGEAVIRHEEHNPVTLPQGLYKVRIVREFDHLTQRTRNVVD